MAWYAELKRRKWYCVCGTDILGWYKAYLYDTWWDSLSEEQKKKVEEHKRMEKEKKEREIQEAFLKLGIISSVIGSLHQRTSKEKYGDIYDEYGFPR